MKKKRTISVGDELVWDYGNMYADNAGNKVACYCGSDKCTGIIGLKFPKKTNETIGEFISESSTFLKQVLAENHSLRLRLKLLQSNEPTPESAAELTGAKMQNLIIQTRSEQGSDLLLH